MGSSFIQLVIYAPHIPSLVAYGCMIKLKVGILDDEPPLADSFGTPLGDSIYSTFVVQEAVRLVNSTDVGKANTWKNALVM